MISSNDYIIYPLVVINDRYNGVYSGAEWTAWEDYPDAIPDDIFGDDDSCCEFWLNANKNNIGFWQYSGRSNSRFKTKINK